MNLRRKLQVFKMLNVSTLEETDEILKQWSLRSTQCAFPIKKDHLYFKCADCSSQPSHCICEECFFSANHTGHNFLYFNKLTVRRNLCVCRIYLFVFYVKNNNAFISFFAYVNITIKGRNM